VRKRPSTRSSSPPVQTGPPWLRTPSDSAPRRVRMVLGARSLHHVLSGCIRLVLWVSNRLSPSKSTIWMTGSYKPRHLKEGYSTCVIRSISRLRPSLTCSLGQQDCPYLTYHDNRSLLPFVSYYICPIGWRMLVRSFLWLRSTTIHSR